MPVVTNEETGLCHGPIELTALNPEKFELSYPHKGKTKTKPFFNVRPKHIYRNIIRLRTQRPNCEANWNKHTNFNINSQEFTQAWKNLGRSVGTSRDITKPNLSFCTGVYGPHTVHI